MPFDSTLPRNNTPADADEMRNQLNGLKDLIDAVAVPTIAEVLAAGESAGQHNLYDLEQLQLNSAGGRIAGNVQGGAGATLELAAVGGTPVLQIRVKPGDPEPQRIVCDGGELVIRSTVATRIQNVVILPDLPVADPHVAGQLWNAAGTLKVSAG